MTDWIEYPEALARLAGRLNASRDELANEIAAWVWLGPDMCGIAAYLWPPGPRVPMLVQLVDRHRFAHDIHGDRQRRGRTRSYTKVMPPRFYYHDAGDANVDYIEPLMGCWFEADEIDRFPATLRFITGRFLIERWSKVPGIRAEALVLEKVAKFELFHIHPVFGTTQGSSPEETFWPPLASGLFARCDVERIEAGFGTDQDKRSEAEARTPAEPRRPSDDAQHKSVKKQRLASVEKAVQRIEETALKNGTRIDRARMPGTAVDLIPFVQWLEKEVRSLQPTTVKDYLKDAGVAFSGRKAGVVRIWRELFPDRDLGR